MVPRDGGDAEVHEPAVTHLLYQYHYEEGASELARQPIMPGAFEIIK